MHTTRGAQTRQCKGPRELRRPTAMAPSARIGSIGTRLDRYTGDRADHRGTAPATHNNLCVQGMDSWDLAKPRSRKTRFLSASHDPCGGSKGAAAAAARVPILKPKKSFSKRGTSLLEYRSVLQGTTYNNRLKNTRRVYICKSQPPKFSTCFASRVLFHARYGT